MSLPFFTGLGLTLTGATQLRLDIGLGPGEGLLLLLFVITALRIFVKGRIATMGMASLGCYTAIGLVLTVGSVMGLLIALSLGVSAEKWDRQILFVFLAFAFPYLYYLAWGSIILQKSVLWMAILSAACLFLLYVLSLLGVRSIGSLELYYGFTRFVGWANNPNQTALVICMVPFLLLHFWRKEQISALNLIVVLIFAIAVGLATKSNALLVGWVLGALLVVVSFVTGTYARNSANGGTIRSGRKSVRALLLGIFVGIPVSMSAFGWWLNANWEGLYRGTVAGGAAGQGEGRVRLWLNALEAWQHSPLVGLGPGHFSGSNQPFMGAEAHNLYIDWLASYGVLGLGFLVYMFFRIGWRLFVNRDFALFAGFTSLLIVSLFHFFARHPVFWFMLFFLLLSSIEFQNRTQRGSEDAS
jgi:O-antigen ligase